MSKIRVLVVDDATVIRKIVSDELALDQDIEVVGTAANGKIALMRIPQLQPDIITLDIEMPEMDGLETLTHLRRDYPKIPVVMFSTLTERGASATLDALGRGATDYATKPSGTGSAESARATVRDDLVRKIKALVPRKGAVPAKAVPPPIKVFSRATPGTSVGITVPSANRPVDIITIGVSTGGPNALSQVLPLLPERFEVPIVLVQHMPPMFTRLLAERLNAQSKVRIVEAAEGMPIEAGTVYIAPGNYHLVLGGNRVAPVCVLNQEQPENSCRPAADVLFRSVVSMYGAGVLGVILTGMGYDGVIGCQHIKRVGGTVLAQDEKSSVVWGMPGAVVEAGLADKILPLESVAGELVRSVRNRSSLSPNLSR